MTDFLTSPIFFAVLGGFMVMFMIQTLIQGPKEADQKKRIEEYMGRLSDEGRANIEEVLSSGDKIGAIKIFREETQVGLLEAKECVAFIEKQMS